ncbi:MAG TPA: amidohydrolase family protein, partial [Dehalococcoidia bacterium]|nr:amidohydrolase family protein [Dehalococcoidia bacterium]
PERTPLLSLLPVPVADELQSRWAERRQAAAGASENARARSRRCWENILQLVGGFHAAGGRVLAGTDCPNVAIVSGFSLHRELELLVRAGLSPMAAIHAATRRAAERLDRQDLFGAIRPGLSADALLLSADPLADIRNTRRIETVFVRGRPLRPDEALAGLRRAP